MGYGMDPSVIYKRHEHEIEYDDPAAEKISNNQIFQDIIELMPGSYSAEDDFHVHDTIIIFFCGKIYPLIVFAELDKDSWCQTDYNKWFCYDFKSAHEIILDMASKKQVKNYLHGTRKFARYGWYGPSAIAHQKSLEQIYEYSGKPHPSFDDLHHHYGTPVIVYHRNFILNPSLKTYRFFAVIDTFTAFQEIAMYISGVLGGQAPPVIEISDHDRKMMHGFNKWSFRKEPTKVR